MKNIKMLNYKDVMLEYCLHGFEAVEAKYNEGSISRHTLAIAHKSLHKEGKTDSKFDEWVWNILPGGNGRPQPKVGETREYSAFSGRGDGAIYCHIPVASLNPVVGRRTLRITFEDDKIIIRRKENQTTPAPINNSVVRRREKDLKERQEMAEREEKIASLRAELRTELAKQRNT